MIGYTTCPDNPLPRLPGTPAKKRTIPHFPFPPLILEGFPAIKNLGSFRESSGRNLTYQKIVDFGSWWNSVFKCGNCGNCGNCGLIVAFVAFVAFVDFAD